MTTQNLTANATLFQVFSRINYENGNRYSLILTYTVLGRVVRVVEAYHFRWNTVEQLDSVIDKSRQLTEHNLAQLPSVELSPSSYRRLLENHADVIQEMI